MSDGAVRVPVGGEVYVPLVDVAWQHRQVRPQIDAAIDRLLTDPSCDDLSFVQGLERQFGEIVEEPPLRCRSFRSGGRISSLEGGWDWPW